MTWATTLHAAGTLAAGMALMCLCAAALGLAVAWLSRYARAGGAP